MEISSSSSNNIENESAHSRMVITSQRGKIGIKLETKPSKKKRKDKKRKKDDKKKKRNRSESSGEL